MTRATPGVDRIIYPAPFLRPLIMADATSYAVPVLSQAYAVERGSCNLRGGCSRARTYDPLIKSQLLYLLSYAPTPRAPASEAPAFARARTIAKSCGLTRRAGAYSAGAAASALSTGAFATAFKLHMPAAAITTTGAAASKTGE